jgi:hypothetical protein
MMDHSDKRTNDERWSKPLPERLPRPTYWPAMLAFGMTLTLLGPVTSMAVTVAGVIFAACALAGWIGEIRA